MIRIAARYLFSVLLFCNLSIAALNPLTSQIQTYLREMQIDPGEVDGVYGPKTKAAIMEFQKLAGLSQDGVADKYLLTNMRRYYSMYTNRKYNYYQEDFSSYQDDNYSYQYSNNQSKCQRALNELSSYSDTAAKYNYTNGNNVHYDSRWRSYSPKYNKKNYKISRKLSKLDRMMKRVQSNCQKGQYQAKRYRHIKDDYYKPRYGKTLPRQRYVKPEYDSSPFLNIQENEMYRLHK
jgi:hypothetical protein